MEAIDVGKRIKSFRKRKGLTLQDLSEKSGMSATAISAIERNVSSPTVNTLASIGKALGESLSSLLGETEIEYVATRASERTSLAVDIRNAVFQSLGSGIPGQRFHPMLGILQPEASSGDEFVNRQGDDFFYVIKGALEVDMNGTAVLLRAGDSLYCRGTTPYRWKNAADGETELLLVTTS